MQPSTFNVRQLKFYCSEGTVAAMLGASIPETGKLYNETRTKSLAYSDYGF